MCSSLCAPGSGKDTPRLAFFRYKLGDALIFEEPHGSLFCCTELTLDVFLVLIPGKIEI